MKGLSVLLVIVLILYGLYSGAMAAWSYIEIGNLVDEVVPREIARTGGDRFETAARGDRIRTAVVTAATKSGIPLAPGSVGVAEEGGAIWVRIAHPYPVVSWQGATKAAIPVSVSRSFPLK